MGCPPSEGRKVPPSWRRPRVLSVVLHAPGVFTVPFDPFPSITDPDPANDQSQTTLTVGGAAADLQVDQLTDTPDPVPDGGDDMTYEVVHLGPVGVYWLGIAESSGTYRLGLGTGIPHLDGSYGTRGTGVILGDYPSDFVEMQLLGDDVVLVRWDAIKRYDDTGVLDASFGTGGEMDIQSDGKILVQGSSAVLRYTRDGALDGTFAGTGMATYDFGLKDRFIAATQDASGRLIIVGHQRTPEDWAEFLVVRMFGDGSLDPDFGHGGYVLEHRAPAPRRRRTLPPLIPGLGIRSRTI